MHACGTSACVHTGFLLGWAQGVFRPSPGIYPSYNTHAQLQQTDLCTVFRNYFK